MPNHFSTRFFLLFLTIISFVMAGQGTFAADQNSNLKLAQRVQKVLANKKLRFTKHRISEDLIIGNPVKVIVKLTSPTVNKTNKKSLIREPKKAV